MSKIVEAYYNSSVDVEWTRLDRHPFEFELTKRHIDQFLGPQSRILDIGGGPGRYAFHYAKMGHSVSLVDLSSGNIAFARERQTALGITLETVEVGNAMNLSKFPTESFDFVICLGPLYHLVAEADRSAVVAEYFRVLKPEGFAIFGFVTHMAQTLSVLRRCPGNIALWENALVTGIETGVNDTAFDTGFTEAYFTRPDQIRGLVEPVGFEIRKIAGAEGIGCQSEERLLELDKQTLERWLEFSFRYSDDPTTLGANQHVICVGQKS